MGKLEKLVVLTVLFAAAVVLAISFNKGVGVVEASDPLSGAEQLLDRSPTASLPTTFPVKGPELVPNESQLEDGLTSSLLLNAGASPASSGDAPVLGRGEGTEEALSQEPESDPTRPILVDTHGLRPSFLDQYMTYEVAEGDTWAGLAQRFYQDGRYTRNLHLVNEDLRELTPGKQILVPVYDFLAVDAGLQAGVGGGGGDPSDEPRFAGLATPVSKAQAPKALAKTEVGKTPEAEVAKTGQALVYVVRPGDTLSDISMAAFGTATRWKEILEANRDKLKKPESLQVGMKLTLPAGAKSLPKETAKNSSSKAPATKPSSTKKKVD